MSSLLYDYSTPGIIGVTEANGSKTEYKFTNDGSLLEVKNPLNQVTTNTYDDNDNIIQIKVNDTIINQFTYDGENRLLTETNSLDQTISYSYGENSDSPTLVTDPKGNSLGFTYDERGNVTKISYVDGTFESFVYDEVNQLIEKTERGGDTFQYTYDKRGRLSKTIFDDGTFEKYNYNKKDNLTSIKDVDGDVTKFAYNGNNQVTKVTYSDGKYISYTYDDLGQRTSILTQDGFQVNYSYDFEGQLTGLTDQTNSTLVSYEYDEVGNLIKETNGNGTFTTYNYDLAGNLTNLVNYASENAINASFSYTYDDLGQKVGEVNNDGIWQYSYDSTGQLTRAIFDSNNPNIADQDLQYVYDESRNRVQTIVNGETVNYIANNLNQYSSVGNAVYSYDTDGNLTQVVAGSDIYSYTYNDENRIIKAETPNGVWEYEYNSLGNRTAIIQDGVRTEYLVDPFGGFGDIIAQYNNGQLTANFAHGLGLVGQFTGSSNLYFDGNAIGSIIGLTDDSGSYVNQYSYQPFGEVLHSVEGVTNPFQFVGELGVMNDSSGLYYMRSRQYDPNTGRFTATDPLNLGGGDTNLYQYGFNNPLSFVDPEGEFAQILIGIGIGIISGLIANYVYDKFKGSKKNDKKTTEITEITETTETTTKTTKTTKTIIRTDPLVLDLDGDGVELVSLNRSTTFFDTNNNGFKEYTSWISSDDGFLVLDANNDGVINDISEMFGDNLTNGFDDLATLDSNGDNVIDVNDTQFNELRIWIDRNKDGITDSGELRTLAQWNIKSINLERTDLAENNSGLLSTGSFTLNDGTSRELAAIALNVNLISTVYNQPVEIKPETLFLPNLRGYGQLADLNIAMSLDQQLLGEMRELVQLDDSNLESVYGKIEDFIFKWAGVEDIDPNSRSGFFDARKHSFLEKFYQEAIDFEITKVPHTQGLRQSWADITNSFISKLAAQSFMRDIFSESSYNVNTDSLETQTNLSDLLVKIEANLPSDSIDAIRYWSYAIGVLDGHGDRFNLSQTEYDDTLKTALGVDLSDYLAALRNPILGGEENDILVGRRTQSSFVDGSLGDDTVTGSKQNDILSGGVGNDRLTGRGGADILTGGEGKNTFIYQKLIDSLLDSMDRITDFKIGSDRLNGPNSVTKDEVRELGEVNSLDETAIQSLLNSEVFGVNKAATFTMNNRTFLTLNDDVAGYSANSDGIIEITGFTGDLNKLAIV